MENNKYITNEYLKQVGVNDPKKKVVFITGGAKGIGATIARKMASLNYNIALNYLKSEEKAQALKAEIENTFGTQVLLLQGDIGSEETVKRMVKKTIDAFERIDCLINNAALCQDNFFHEKTGKEFENVLNTNLVGTFLTCKYVGMEMKKQKSGRIINISSTNGIDTNEVYSMDYDASKAGVLSLTHNFAKALAPFVLVNAVAPGWVNTESVLEMNPTYLESEKKKCMLERFGEPKEIAEVVAFLASDEASYINNTIIRVDGGLK